ncbi:MAG: fasciclin domain-containing protein [Planctomycetes bacterium]|nr:fasciclin domain-containing protein [Planctomycetota bacterium]
MNRLSLVAALLSAAALTASAQSSIVETAKQAGSFSTLLTAVEKAGLAETLMGDGPFTVFAPTDEAFAALPEGTLESLLTPEGLPKLKLILTHHVLSGAADSSAAKRADSVTPLSGQPLPLEFADGMLSVAGANVVKADIVCTNGVIHVIDSVMLPNLDDVVETASKVGAFKTLLAAAKAAGLVDALKAEGPITVFAPTDEAFAKLPEGTVASLLKPENKDQLVKILTAHVVQGRVGSAAAIKGGKAPTLQGTTWTITSDEGAVLVGNAQVVKADVYTSNGVIHVIDTVLIPAK